MIFIASHYNLVVIKQTNLCFFRFLLLVQKHMNNKVSTRKVAYLYQDTAASFRFVGGEREMENPPLKTGDGGSEVFKLFLT